MKNTIYTNCKELIKQEADREHRDNPRDKPRVRECLNNLLDELIRQIDFYLLREKLTEKRARQYENWLTNYTIDRHEK